MLKKRISTEDLALMVKHGFEGVDKRFDEMEQHFDQRFVNLESDISYLKSRVMEIGRTLERHEELLEEHSEELKQIHSILDRLTDSQSENRIITHKAFSELETRVTILERKILQKK